MNFQEENVIIQSEFLLEGTLTIPNGADKKYPAVIMLHGSGPTDRDGNIKDMKINIFKELSELITPLGFITLRYDKRGVAKSEGSYLRAGFWDLVDDAEVALKFLQEHPNVDHEKIILLGHSEGTLIAPALHNRHFVQGLILLAGAAEPLKDTIVRQAESTFKELDKSRGFKGFMIKLLAITKRGRIQHRKTMEVIEASTDDVIDLKGKKVNAKWLREHFAYNVLNDLAQVECPTLAIAGAKDLQILPEHAKTITNTVKGKAEYYVIEGMNHILRRQDNQPSMLTLKQDYKQLLDQPIDQDLKDKLKYWLEKYYL